MATSAANLQLILDIALANTGDMSELKKAIHSKGLLPKKLIEVDGAAKENSPYASKQAKEYAEKETICIKGIKGTSVKGKITIKDLKDASAPSEPKISISPPAMKYARDNGIDIKGLQGTGKGGNILLADVKALDVDSDSDSEDGDEIKLTPAAARAVKQHDIDDDDLASVEGTGKGGAIKLSDLKDIIDEIKKETE